MHLNFVNSAKKGLFSQVPDGADEVRIAYVLNGEEMKKSMEILKHGLAAYAQAFPEQCK